MRTIPRSLFKSSTKDLSLPIFELVFSLVCHAFVPWHKGHSHAYNTCSLFKSSTKDLSLPIFELVFSFVCSQLLCLNSAVSNFMILDSRRLPILTHDNIWEGCISPLSSMDSGLEAFSRNPTHGSFSALTFQSTELTNYVNQRFLSY